jgi:tetratricopeptide (TPR) repeat protein
MVIFRQLNQDYPELPEPYNNLAVLYAGQGDLDKARIALEMAIRTNPSYAAAHENLGDVLLQLASQSYAKALQNEPRNASIPNKLALIRNLLSPPVRSQPNRLPLTNTTPASSSPVTPASPAAKP